MKAIIKLDNKRIEVENIQGCVGVKKFTGLMFKNKNTNALLFEFPSPTNQKIHSFFCNPFLAVWLDEKNNIIETKLISRIGTYAPKLKFSKLLEVPLNKSYMPVIEILLDKRKV